MYFLFLIILFVFFLLNTVELVYKILHSFFPTKYYIFHFLYVSKKNCYFSFNNCKIVIIWLYYAVLTIS